MRVRVKICGITRPEDGRLAAQLGADAIGLVFYGPSPRFVAPDTARVVVAALPAFVTTVGLFVDASPDQISETLAKVPLDVLQFHGNESAADCVRWGRPWIKAVRMRDDVDLSVVADEYAGASALLLDAWQPGKPGGTGTTFDWSVIPQTIGLPVVLAGGLSPDNVRDAIMRVRPWAVDISGGVEAEKGIKDPEKMNRFMSAVESAGVEFAESAGVRQ